MDWHRLAWTGMDWHELAWLFISYYYILITDRLTDRQTDRQTYIGTCSVAIATEKSEIPWLMPSY